jgi:hypothetical protein
MDPGFPDGKPQIQFHRCFMKKLYRVNVSALVLFYFLANASVGKAQSNASMPDVIKKGLSLYEKGGVIVAFNSWQQGGMLEGDSTANARLHSFTDMTAAIGNYKSSDVIRIKAISNQSRLVYFAMNFNRGVIYAKFLIYHAETEWVVQHMVFGARPESIMPWLALEGETERP